MPDRVQMKVNHLIFWIGGAADKYDLGLIGKTNIMEKAMLAVAFPAQFVNEPYISVKEFYIGANSSSPKQMTDYPIAVAAARSFEKKHFGQPIRIHMVAHSWGGTLAVALCDKIRVDCLITLDPVGGVTHDYVPIEYSAPGIPFATTYARLFPGYHMEAPKVGVWYNINAYMDGLGRDVSDGIATAGGDWNDKPDWVIKGGAVQTNNKKLHVAKGQHIRINTHHGYARTMLFGSGVMKKLAQRMRSDEVFMDRILEPHTQNTDQYYV